MDKMTLSPLLKLEDDFDIRSQFSFGSLRSLAGQMVAKLNQGEPASTSFNTNFNPGTVNKLDELEPVSTSMSTNINTGSVPLSYGTISSKNSLATLGPRIIQQPMPVLLKERSHLARCPLALDVSLETFLPLTRISVYDVKANKVVQSFRLEMEKGNLSIIENVKEEDGQKVFKEVSVVQHTTHRAWACAVFSANRMHKVGTYRFEINVHGHGSVHSKRFRIGSKPNPKYLDPNVTDLNKLGEIHTQEVDQMMDQYRMGHSIVTPLDMEKFGFFDQDSFPARGGTKRNRDDKASQAERVSNKRIKDENAKDKSKTKSLDESTKFCRTSTDKSVRSRRNFDTFIEAISNLVLQERKTVEEFHAVTMSRIDGLRLDAIERHQEAMKNLDMVMRMINMQRADSAPHETVFETTTNI